MKGPSKPSRHEKEDRATSLVIHDLWDVAIFDDLFLELDWQLGGIVCVMAFGRQSFRSTTEPSKW